jgi:hypothetical protein
MARTQGSKRQQIFNKIFKSVWLNLEKIIWSFTKLNIKLLNYTKSYEILKRDMKFFKILWNLEKFHDSKQS